MIEIILERCRQHAFKIEQAQLVAFKHHPFDYEAIQARRSILIYSTKLDELQTVLTQLQAPSSPQG